MCLTSLKFCPRIIEGNDQNVYFLIEYPVGKPLNKAAHKQARSIAQDGRASPQALKSCFRLNSRNSSVNTFPLTAHSQSQDFAGPGKPRARGTSRWQESV